MLVMRRRAGERLQIGSEIEIEILEVGPTRVKLGISAPPQLAIARKEVLLTRAENLGAAQNRDAAVRAWLKDQPPLSGAPPVNLLTLLKESAKKPRTP